MINEKQNLIGPASKVLATLQALTKQRGSVHGGEGCSIIKIGTAKHSNESNN